MVQGEFIDKSAIAHSACNRMIKEMIEHCERAIKTTEELPAGLKKGSSNFHNGKVAAYKEMITTLEQWLRA